jgi:hypothetical protein
VPGDASAAPWRSRPFLLLWSAVVVGSTGTVLAVLALSITTYDHTHSNLAAGLVTATQWVVPLLLAPKLATLSIRYPPRTLVVAAECASIPVVVALGLLAPAQPVAAGAMLVARSFLDAISKTATPIAVRRTVADPAVARAVAAIEAARLYGAVLGAAAGSLLLGRLSLTEILLCNAGCLVVSAALYAAAGLPATVVARAAGPVRGLTALRRGVTTVARDPLLWRAFLLVAGTTVPQALHNLGRTALPVENLGLGAAGVSLLAVVTTVALGVGAFLGSVAPSGPARAPDTTWWLLLVPPALLCLASVIPDATVSFGAYGLYVVLFEVGYVWFTATAVARCPEESIEEVAALRTTVLPGVLFVSLCGFGLLVDLAGMLGGGIGYLLLAILVGLSQSRLHRRAQPQEVI